MTSSSATPPRFCGSPPCPAPLRGGSCLSRHRAECAGAESELLLTVSAHFDLISSVVGVKTKSYVSWLSVTWGVLFFIVRPVPSSCLVGADGLETASIIAS